MNLRLCHHVKGTVWGEKTDAHAWGRMEHRVKKNGRAKMGLRGGCGSKQVPRDAVVQ